MTVEGLHAGAVSAVVAWPLGHHSVLLYMVQHLHIISMIT